MAFPFLGEIRLVSFSFAPSGWMKCDGQLVRIADYIALFDLVGNTYGGDGITTFGLPDLRGRVIAGGGAGILNLGTSGGEEMHTLTTAEMAAHGHAPRCSDSAGNQAGVAGAVWASDSAKLDPPYRNVAPNAAMNAQSVIATGGGMGHNNMQPFLTLNYVIAMFGIFPSV